MEFNQAVLEGDAKWIASLIEGFLTTDDYLDRTGETPKNPREMTVVILLVALRKRYTVRIGRRADYRRFDAVLVPRTQGGLGMVMGIRIAGVREDPAAVADTALEQIRDADYRTEFSGEVLLIGICFKNGTAEVRFETVTVRGDAGWMISRRG